MALAALLVRIGADVTDLTKGLSDVDKDIVKAGKNITKLGEDLTKGLTFPIVAAGGALAASALSVGKFADELLDLADQTGLSTDTLQEFRHVATVAGVDTDTLANAAIKLTSGLQGTGDQSKQLSGAIGELGLSVKDSTGKLLPMDALLPQIMSKLSGMQDTTTRNTLAADIFGKSWKDLAPIMGLGAGKIDELRARAHDLGLVLSNETVEAADAFRVKVDVLKEQVMALTNKVGAATIEFVGLHPAISAGGASVLGLLAAVGPFLVMGGKLAVLVPKLKVAFMALGGPIGLTILAVGALVAAGVQLVKHWNDVKLRMVLVWGAIKNAVFSAIDFILEGLEKLTRFIPGLNDKIKDVRKEFDELAIRSMARTGDQIAELEEGFLDLATATETETEAVTVLKSASDKTAEAIRSLATRHADALPHIQALTGAIYSSAQSVGALQRAQNLLEGSITDTTAAMGIYKGLVGETKAAEDTFAITTDALNALLKEGKISQDEYNEAMKVAQQRMKDAEGASGDLRGSLSELLSNFTDLGIKIPDSVQKLVSEVSSKWAILQAILSAPATIEKLKTDWVTFFNNLAEAVNTFWGAIKGIADKVRGFFLDVGAGAGQLGGGGGFTLNVNQGGPGSGGGTDVSPLLIQWVHESRLYQRGTWESVQLGNSLIGQLLQVAMNARDHTAMVASNTSAMVRLLSSGGATSASSSAVAGRVMTSSSGTSEMINRDLGRTTKRTMQLVNGNMEVVR